MATFTAGTSFTDGVTGDVTAAKLNALVANATPLSNFITDRTAETSIATDDLVLISDTSESGALNKMTVANLMKAEMTGTINSTAGTITTATIPTLTSGTTTGTAATFTSGTITTLNSTTGTITTGVIPTLTSITLITSGTGTAAAPAIVPTGDTNTGIFFPATDTIAFSEGGTESMRIDSSGNVGIGVVTSISSLHIKNATPVSKITLEDSSTNRIGQIAGGSDGSGGYLAFSTGNNGGSISERLRIDSSGNVGIGTTSPSTKLHVASGNLRLDDNQYILWGGNTNGINGNNASNLLAFYTNSTERLRIDSSGFVSIGTATGLSALHVHGNVTLSNTTTATSAGTGGLSKPTTYAGYLTVSINGTSRKIPYYAT